MRLLFEISVAVDTPIVIGQDEVNGRRQLIPITSGTVKGEDLFGNVFNGIVLPGGVDSQVIRPNGTCELSARYGVKLDDGRSFYIENNGIRTVPDEYAEIVKNGGFVDPSLYYFATKPTFEVFDRSLEWMEKHIFICKATRKPDAVILSYYVIE